VPKTSHLSSEFSAAEPRQVATAVPLDNAVNPYVKKAIAYWRSLCGGRRFPARADMTLRGLAAILPYAVIIGVIDGGADFEFRYVGEAQREAFNTSFKGLRVSQIEAAVPELGTLLRGVYEQARATGYRSSPGAESIMSPPIPNFCITRPSSCRSAPAMRPSTISSWSAFRSRHRSGTSRRRN
jgi:hypothetical protein